MFRYRVLDHYRVDVVAAASDQGFAASFDVEATLFVGVAQIASFEGADLEDTRVVRGIALTR
ncbi:MAG: hypothetical protein ACI9I0_000830 [Rhodoferax sp.]